VNETPALPDVAQDDAARCERQTAADGLEGGEPLGIIPNGPRTRFGQGDRHVRATSRFAARTLLDARLPRDVLATP
jgi:hypothetical protein